MQMLKRVFVSLIAIMLVFTITACGKKSKEDVQADLNKTAEKMDGYKANATLTIRTGVEAQTYNVEILHKKPSFYRVILKNTKKGQSQIIIRNDTGVFVLTPALNKSFKFQSDWPLNSSQAYLYESLIKDVLLDKNAKFTDGEKTYTFETKTNYQNNNMMPSQKVIFNKKNLAPKSVKIMDTDKNPMVEVSFKDFKFNAKSDKKDFDVNNNMKAAQVEGVPTMAQSGDSVAIMYPTESALPEGVSLQKEEEVEMNNSVRTILTYSGEKDFTIIQEKSTVAEVSTPIASSGEPVDLGDVIGILTSQSLSWSTDGVEYMIASEDLTTEEMIEVASSVGQMAEK